MRLKSIIAIFMLLASWAKMSAAQEMLPQEQITTHISEYSCLPGDMLWLSIYVSNNAGYPNTNISELALVEFVDAQNNSLVRKKVLLQNGVGACSVSVPDSLGTGMCSVLVYTNWLKNFGEECYSVSKVMVFNPTIAIADSITAKPAAELQFSPDLDGRSSIKINTNKLIYALREPVNVEIETKEELLSFSVSAAIKAPQTLSGHQTSVMPSGDIDASAFEFYPDYNGIVLSGRLVNKYDNKAIGNVQIVLSFPGDFVNVDYATTNADGSFSFLIPPAEGDKDMVFYLPSEDGVIQLDELFVNGFRNEVNEHTEQLNEATKQFFTQRFIRKQLNERFAINKRVQHNIEVKNSGLDFYGKAYQEVALKDFEKLDSIGEYFYELTPTVHFPIKQGKQLLYITDPQTNFSLGDKPVVFIDGVYYPNWEKLAKLNHTLIEKIDVIPKTYYYGEKTYDGIVSICTKTKNLAGVELLPEMSRMIYPLSDTSEEFVSKALNTAAHIPDLRDLLHWQSSLSCAKGESINLSFYTSDVEGEFVITLIGITKSGKFVSVEKQILVSERN